MFSEIFLLIAATPPIAAICFASAADYAFLRSGRGAADGLPLQ
jgi:hypothetical protein